MRLHTASKGRSKGNQFWGCSRYPKCRHTLNLNEVPTVSEPPQVPDDSPPSSSDNSTQRYSMPVHWSEYAARSGYSTEYVPVGSIPATVRNLIEWNETLDRMLSQTLLISKRDESRPPASEESRLISSLVMRFLQRGRAPAPTLGVEREALNGTGLISHTNELPESRGTLGWEFKPESRKSASAQGLSSRLAERTEFSLDASYKSEINPNHGLLQSPLELCFLEDWVPQALGAQAGHWFVPQASMEQLLRAGGYGGNGAQRVDFLFAHPGGNPFVVEIDGPEHASARDVDATRDELLGRMNIDVVRVPNDEVAAKQGPHLEEIRERCCAAFESFDPNACNEAVAEFTRQCTFASKLQFSIAKAMFLGLLRPENPWCIEVVGMGQVAVQAIEDALELLAALDRLYAANSLPSLCRLRVSGEGTAHAWKLNERHEWQACDDPVEHTEVLRILVESRASPFHDSERLGDADLIIRPAYLPLDLAPSLQPIQCRESIASLPHDQAAPHLASFLRHGFRKRAFRAKQSEAVYNVLCQTDTMVLLPTGAGKSLIYQLAGLLMPGVTLIVDPITALIDDQIDGLRDYGIDRATPIASHYDWSDREMQQVYKLVASGGIYFVLIAPERLQMPSFRESLRTLTGSQLVNLAVIDEAHCVSEWGHDFRPSYLKLAGNLRRLGKDDSGSAPPILGLTGTASRAVLQDLLIELSIEPGQQGSVIRPDSFNRPEIDFQVVKTSPIESPKSKLEGALQQLPSLFRVPTGEFFAPRGGETASGIVFTPHANGDYGILAVKQQIKSAFGVGVAVYSGSAPKDIDEKKWKQRKQNEARSFKKNRTPLLVATKAFGMGIDKPNIRYVIHFGMPSSLEAFYQEVGRAGRDGRSARSMVVFSEYDQRRSDSLLDPRPDYSELRQRCEEADSDWNTKDDITRNLWFHTNGFDGEENEVEEVRSLLQKLGELREKATIDIPRNKAKEQERAILRLVRIGLVSDYEVDYGAAKFTIHVNRFELEECREELLQYIRASQPAMARSMSEEVDRIESGDPHETALEIVKLLIGFSYRVIERSRRRMLQESVQLARQAKGSEDIRKRLLNYLQEGLGSERIEELLAEESVELDAWKDVIMKIENALDAEQVRGTSIRALESYPEHPGLLLLRAVSESLCSDGNERTSSDEIETALRSALLDYGIEDEEIARVLESLFQFSSAEETRNLQLPLLLACLRLADENNRFEVVYQAGRSNRHRFTDQATRAGLMSFGIDRIASRLQPLVATFAESHRDSRVQELLNGGAHEPTQ